MVKTIGKSALGTVELKTKHLAIPEWKGEVVLRELSAADGMNVQNLAMDMIDLETEEFKDEDDALSAFQFRVLMLSWINEDGTRVLENDEAHLLANEPNSIISRMSKAAMELSGFSANAKKEAEKNS